MKLQLTAIAAALALSSSMAMATTIVSTNNLTYTSAGGGQGGGYGVDNDNTPIDTDAWDTAGFPTAFQPDPAFTNFQTGPNGLDNMPGSTAAVGD
ncbi:hypothetical protein P8631_13900, partial [Guyparkeria sp. 1SP6A2]|nr:hypothetical protein [Guyparkeria sp. 1SP6A2]